MYTYKTENKQGVLKVQVNAQDFEKEVEKSYEKNKAKYKVQGFRPGKAPRKVIEQHYGDTVFFDDAFEACVQNEYSKFLKENPQVKPADYPTIDENSFTVDNGLEVTLRFDLMPEVTLGSIKGLTSKPRKVKIDDKMIEQEIKALQEHNARFVESQSPAESGDYATIDFVGSVDGVKFEGGSAQDYRLELGSHTFIEGFEEQVVGMKIGQQKDVKVTFPTNYQAENLKGKAAVFAVTLKKVEKKQLPEVNDKFISDTTEFESLQAYKEDVVARLTKEEEKRAQLDYQAQLIDEICDRSQVDLPESLVENETHEMIHEFEHRLSHQGMKLEDYLSYIGSDYQKFHDERKDTARKNLKTRLVLQKLIAQNKISVSGQDVDAKIKEYAAQYSLDAEEVKKGLSQQDYLYFNNQALMDKIFEFIKAQNK